ncbi:MAG TPA: hypothetical protein VGK97_12235 [Spongiibacteraceae bacterium]|jgi:hypothetical protein
MNTWVKASADTLFYDDTDAYTDELCEVYLSDGEIRVRYEVDGEYTVYIGKEAISILRAHRSVEKQHCTDFLGAQYLKAFGLKKECGELGKLDCMKTHNNAKQSQPTAAGTAARCARYEFNK